MRQYLLAAIVGGACACGESPSSSVSPDLSIRAAKPVGPSPSISVVSLGTLPHSSRGDYGIGLALNNGASRAETQVAGATKYGAIDEHPFTWTLSAGMSALMFDFPTYGWAFGISDNGMIVGEVSPGGGNRAFVAIATTPATYLPVPAETRYSSATGISADGVCISGGVATASGSFAVLWRNGVLETAGSGTAKGLSNDCLVIVGNSGGRAAVWRSNGSGWTMETLPSAGRGWVVKNRGRIYSEATDISPSGEYVAGRRVDSLASYAVVWRRLDGSWVPSDMPGKTVYAFGVDNSGRAVGVNTSSQPMLWTRSSAGSYTATMLPPIERSTTGWAGAINELGQISGRSQTRSGPQAVLWTVN